MKHVLLFIFLFFIFNSSYSQETFGPYTSDGNTVLLLHFDGNLTDASGNNAEGTVVGDVTFSEDAQFGESVYLNNSGTFPNYQDLLALYGSDTTASGQLKADSAYYADAVPNDTSYIVISAGAALDLSGDWTIEGWIKNVDNQEWSTGGLVVGKSDTLGSFNYYVGNQSPGQFRGGFHEDNMGTIGWDGVTTVQNFNYYRTGDQAPPMDSTEAPKEYDYGWLHFTFQHDAAAKWIAFATHNEAGELLSYVTKKISSSDFNVSSNYQFHPGDGMPSIGVGNDLIIGWGNNKSVHAYLDEIRISDVVRSLDNIPPVARSAEPWNIKDGGSEGGDQEGSTRGRLPNPDVDDTSYPVKAEFKVLGKANGIASATLYYHTRMYPIDERIASDAAGWQSIEMSALGDGFTWQADIPQQPFGTVVEYYMVAETDDGVTQTLGKDWDWFSHHYQGAGFARFRGFPDTYMRFVVVKKNSLVLDLNMDDLQPDNVPADVSEWGANVSAVGTYKLPDEVPDEGAAGESFSSLELDQNLPGYIEVLDNEHMKSQSWTSAYWFKCDTFNNSFTFVMQNGSRWEDDEPDYDEGWAYGFWQNNPGLEVRNPNNYIRTYSMLVGDLPHPFLMRFGTDVFDLEKGKWYKHVAGLDYTGDPTVDSVYTIVVDEDGFLVGKGSYNLRVPPSFVEGRFRIGHRGHPGIPYYDGFIDHVKYWNYYRSPQEDPDLWAYTISSIEDEANLLLPYKFALLGNYPNPFNPNTVIKFTIPSRQKVELAIFDVLGRQVKTLISRELPAGEYDAKWDGTNVLGKETSSGLYFYKLKGKKDVKTKKMLLVR